MKLLSDPGKEYRLFENTFHRWILVHATNPYLGWSGSCWVAINEHGFPVGGVQVSNFPSIATADEAARVYGLEPRKPDPALGWRILNEYIDKMPDQLQRNLFQAEARLYECGLTRISVPISVSSAFGFYARALEQSRLVWTAKTGVAHLSAVTVEIENERRTAVAVLRPIRPTSATLLRDFDVTDNLQ